MLDQNSREAVCVLLQICKFLFKKLLLRGCSRSRSDMKAAAHGFGLHGAAVIGQQCMALFLPGALVSRVSWNQFSSVEIWMQSCERVSVAMC